MSSSPGIPNLQRKGITSSLSLNKEGSATPADRSPNKKQNQRIEKRLGDGFTANTHGKKLKHAQTFIITKNELIVDEERSPWGLN